MSINRFSKLGRHLIHRLGHYLKHLRLYSRLMICYILIFLIVSYAFAFIATRYYIQYTAVKQLEESRNALSAICNYYEQKQTRLSDIILPLYQTDKNKFYIDSMLNSPSNEEYFDPLDRMIIVDVLQDITERDGDIEEILLYKNINGSKFVYQRENKTFQIVGQNYPFFDDMLEYESGRIITGTRKASGNSALLNQNVYGLGGILGLEREPGVQGKFLITFNTDAINSVFQSYSDNYGRFILATLNGDVVFDSEGDYNGEKFPLIDLLESGGKHATIGRQQYYIQTIEGQKGSYIGANIVPDEILGDSNIPALIFGTATLIAIICIVLYFMGGHFISRKMKEIVLAMNRVGANNLSYRIPISKQSDEFSEIAIKFNEMCDELQKTIDHEYINLIKKKNAQLESLQAGINPHFLYNTLEVIRVKAVDSGNHDVGHMIVDLANLYRAMVKNCTFIPIRNEINICDVYSDIFSYHYAKSLCYEVDIDPQIMRYGIPKNLLQPIIENYFIHGIRNEGVENHFTIHGYLSDEDIYFVFEDNGRGINQIHLEKIKRKIEATKLEAESGYGLLSVQKRIRLIYGDKYGIAIESEENSMTCITLRIKALTCDELEASLESPQQLGE